MGRSPSAALVKEGEEFVVLSDIVVRPRNESICGIALRIRHSGRRAAAIRNPALSHPGGGVCVEPEQR